MLSESDNAIAIVVLVVLDAAINTWWGALTPYEAKKLPTDERHNFERFSAGVTLVFGMTAAYLTKKWTPLIASVGITVGLFLLYEYEGSELDG